MIVEGVVAALVATTHLLSESMLVISVSLIPPISVHFSLSLFHFYYSSLSLISLILPSLSLSLISVIFSHFSYFSNLIYI
jgi:hypothetical protein